MAHAFYSSVRRQRQEDLCQFEASVVYAEFQGYSVKLCLRTEVVMANNSRPLRWP